jgi:putative colanic acid biosynthesis UDP-glucose lipid carrier transferase
MYNVMFKESIGLDLLRRLLDVLIVAVAAEAASAYHFGKPLDELESIYDVLMYVCCGLAFYLFSKFQLYASWRGRPLHVMFGQLAVSWALILLIGLFFSYLVHGIGQLSRLWVFYWFFAGALLLMAHRLVVYHLLRWMRRWGMNIKRVIIVGYGRTGQEIHKRALQQDWYGYEVKAIHCEPDELKYVGDDHILHIQHLDDISEYATTLRIDEIWLALPMNGHGKLEKIQYLLRNALADIRWIPDTPGIRMISRRTIDFMGMLTVDLNCPEANGLRGIIKDLFDKLFAFAVLVVLALPFLVIAICIKYSSPGPVFFKQVRHGLNGRKFFIYKFRTMELHVEHNTVTQATQNDARVTWIGRFLRRTSIDELPQFINVLKGDMSVVGPRPHALQHNEFYEDELDVYMLRHRVKPGITGWAQIHGLRGETDTIEKMSKRVQFDLQYIQNWSLMLDLKIILWTACKGWTGKNAY